MSSLQRGIEILLALGTDEAVEAGGLGVVRIANVVGREKSQVSRALKALATSGLIERDPTTRGYRLGWQLFALASRGGDSRLRAAAPAVLRQLVLATGETAHLSVLAGTEVLTVFTEAPAVAVRATGWVGRRVPAWCTSSGRALLFGMTTEEVRARFAGIEFAAGPRSPTSIEELLVRLAAAREGGVAVADEEFEADLVGVAAPVLDASGRVVAAINISAPAFRFRQRVGTAAAAVRAAAGELSHQIGHVDATPPSPLSGVCG